MTEAAKHTDGPWHIDSMKAGSWFISDDNSWSICSRLSTVGHMEQESYANAHLIAAAPDLLSALKECALQIAQTHNRKLTMDEQIALDAARAAIAKAGA